MCTVTTTNLTLYHTVLLLKLNVVMCSVKPKASAEKKAGEIAFSRKLMIGVLEKIALRLPIQDHSKLIYFNVFTPTNYIFIDRIAFRLSFLIHVHMCMRLPLALILRLK